MQPFLLPTIMKEISHLPERYFRFEYLMHLPNEPVKMGVGYQSKKFFDPNNAKDYVMVKILNGNGAVTLGKHTEISKEEFDKYMS